MRAEALTRYRELRLPDTTEEHWRFTDLAGFDPDAFEKGSDPEGQTLGKGARSMLDVDEEGSHFTLVQETASATPDLHSYTNAAEEFFLGPGSKFEYVSVQNLS